MIQLRRPRLDWFVIGFWTAALAFCALVWWAVYHAMAWAWSLRDVRLLP
jgi:hypothetical protein